MLFYSRDFISISDQGKKVGTSQFQMFSDFALPEHMVFNAENHVIQYPCSFRPKM